MEQTEVKGLVDRFAAVLTPRIMVLGDIIVDRYVWGGVDRISPEAPIPVLRADRDDLRLGGSANVANNLKALSADVCLAGLAGADAAGDELRELLQSAGLDAGAVVADPGRPTTVKTRHMAQGQQILRVDRERILNASEEHGRSFLAAFDRFKPSCLVLSDYGKGALPVDILRTMIDRAREAGVPVVVDPKTADYSRYGGATAITPNRVEFEKASGRDAGDPEALREGAKEIISRFDLGALVVTLGPEGIYTVCRDGVEERIPTRARAVYDVTGAGDTVIAVLGYALGGGLSLFDGVRLANAGAGVVVGRVGAAVIKSEEIREALLMPDRPEGGKIRTRDEIGPLTARLKAAGKHVVMTNGCFDILHAGHVEYLAYARSLGTVLVVGVNSDESVRRMNKGAGRPIVSLEDRMRVLAGLEAVDLVVPFDENTPRELVQEVQPDTLVKGEDWRERGVVGRTEVEERGGRVVLAPLRPGVSSSTIIDRIRRGADASAAPGEPSL